MPTSKKPSLIDAPAYTLREATRLTGISFGTLHAWTHGKRGGGAPIIHLASGYWTFTNIVEAHTLRALRKTHLVRLDAVHSAVRYVELRLKVTHPLARKVFTSNKCMLRMCAFRRSGLWPV